MGAATVPLVQEATVTGKQVDALKRAVEANQEHIGPLAKPIMQALYELRTLRRSIPGIHAPSGDLARGPHGGGFPCKEH